MLLPAHLERAIAMSTNPLLTLSSANLKKAAALQARIEQLQAKLAGVVGAGEVPTAAPMATRAPRRSVSVARRKRLSLIAKARWKQAKAAGKTKL
jgi:hypothetical protein